jgi:hypothetical protein
MHPCNWFMNVPLLLLLPLPLQLRTQGPPVGTEQTVTPLLSTVAALSSDDCTAACVCAHPHRVLVYLQVWLVCDIRLVMGLHCLLLCVVGYVTLLGAVVRAVGTSRCLSGSGSLSLSLNLYLHCALLDGRAYP